MKKKFKIIIFFIAITISFFLIFYFKSPNQTMNLLTGRVSITSSVLNESVLRGNYADIFYINFPLIFVIILLGIGLFIYFRFLKSERVNYESIPNKEDNIL